MVKHRSAESEGLRFVSSWVSYELRYIFSYSIYKHDAIDIADPSSMQDECHMTFVIDLIGGVRVDSSWGLRIFLCPTLVIRRKTSFSISFDCFHQFFFIVYS